MALALIDIALAAIQTIYFPPTLRRTPCREGRLPGVHPGRDVACLPAASKLPARFGVQRIPSCAAIWLRSKAARMPWCKGAQRCIQTEKRFAEVFSQRPLPAHEISAKSAANAYPASASSYKKQKPVARHPATGFSVFSAMTAQSHPPCTQGALYRSSVPRCFGRSEVPTR